MVVFQDLEKLQKHVERLLNSDGIKLISIDGEDGSGKSTLAKHLSESLNIIHLNLDDERYFEKNKGGYVKHLKYEKIKLDLDFLSNAKAHIFDGVCNLKILQQLDIKPDLRIYVKELVYGIWGYEETLEYSKDVKDVIRKQRNKLKNFMEMAAKLEGKEIESSESSEESLSEEILGYHFEYKPNLNADIIFEREAVKSSNQ